MSNNYLERVKGNKKDSLIGISMWLSIYRNCFNDFIIIFNCTPMMFFSCVYRKCNVEVEHLIAVIKLIFAKTETTAFSTHIIIKT